MSTTPTTARQQAPVTPLGRRCGNCEYFETVRKIFDMLLLSRTPRTDMEARIIGIIETRHYAYFCEGKTVAEWEENEQTADYLPEWTDEREAHLREIAAEATGESALWLRELFAEIDRQRQDIATLIEGASEHEANG